MKFKQKKQIMKQQRISIDEKCRRKNQKHHNNDLTNIFRLILQE
jgi:hypothetical protein